LLDNTGNCLPNIGHVAALQAARILDSLVIDSQFVQHDQTAKSGTL